MSDAQYRRELELELERLTKELADVRVEKAQQRQRIENLQLEQNQLNDQLSQKTAGDKELRTDLAQQLHTLHQVVKQKKQEHSKVRKDWERSQEQYNHLKQTVGLLKGTAVNDEEDDNSLTDDLNGVPGQRADAKQLLGSMVIPSSTAGASSNGDEAKKQIEDFTWEESVAGDNDTVITEMTKDSLQVHRHNRQINHSEFDDDTSTVITEMTKDSMQLTRNRRSRNMDTDENTLGDNGTVVTDYTKDSLQMHRQKQSRKASNGGGDGGLNRFFTKEAARSRSPNEREGGAGGAGGGGSRGSGGKPTGNRLGAFFEKERKKPAKEEKDMKSASE